jgi:hypothetical protein
VPEVPFDGLLGDKERLCDLAIGETFGSEVGDAPFRCSERIDAASDETTRAGTSGNELGVRALGQSCCPAALRKVQPLA